VGSIALLAALSVVFFWRIVFRGEVLYWGDILLQFHPWRAFTQWCLAHNQLPLWNPYVFCGSPFLANAQSAVLYPPNWALLWLPPHRALSYGAVVHVFLSGVFLYLFLRALRLSRLSAWTGAVVFMFSGFTITRLQFPSLTNTCAWLPFLFWATERLGQQPTARRASVLAAGVGLQFLAGHPQMSFLGLLGLGSYWLARGWNGRRSGTVPGGEGRQILCFGGALALGALLAAAQLGPTYEYMTHSSRAAFSYAQATRFSLPPWQMVSFFIPNLFGNPATNNYFGGGNYWELCGYVGLLPLLLVLSGLSFRRNRAALFWGGLVVGSLLLAWGRYAPFYRLAYLTVPGFRAFRDPARFLYLYTLGLAVLTAYGLENLTLDEPGERKKFEGIFSRVLQIVLFCGIIGVSVFLGSFSLTKEYVTKIVEAILLHGGLAYQASDLEALGEGMVRQSLVPVVFLLGLWGGLRWQSRRPHLELPPLLAGFVVVDLFFWGLGHTPVTPAAAFRPSAVPPELRQMKPLERFYTPQTAIDAVARKYFNYVGYGDRSAAAVAHIRAQFVPNMNVADRVAGVTGYDPLRPQAWERWAQAWEQLRDPEQWAGALAWMNVSRVWFPEGIAEAPPKDRIHRLTEAGPRAFVASWEEVRDRFRGWSADIAEWAAPATVKEYAINRIEIQTRPPQAGYLVVLDLAYPGWLAYVHDRPRKMEPDPAFWFRCLPLVEGENRVTLVFHPSSFRMGLYASLCVTAFLIFVQIAPKSCKKSYSVV